ILRPSTSTSTSGSSQYRPREPLRTISTETPRRAASSPMAAATRSAPTERAVVSDGTKILWLLAMPLALSQQRVQPLRSHPAVDVLVDHDRRRARAVTEAIHGLEAEAAVGRGLVKVDLQRLLHVPLELARAHRLAGLGPAQVQGALAGLVTPKEVIERHDAVHFGAGQIQHV